MFRRTFLSLSVLPLISGTAIASTLKSVDLLIVGAGAAGLAAACRAAELGIKNVVIIEKEPLIGGSSIRCGGHWSVSETDYQRSLGIKDKDEWFFSDLMEAGQWKNDPRLVKVFIEKGREEYEFLNSLRVQPFSLWASGGSGVPRGHVFDPHKLVRTLLTFAIDHGVKVLTGVKAQRLLMDNSQSITGVEIKRLGGTEVIKTKCVLLASGGFGNNRKMLERYVSDLENVQVFSGNGNTGDGHQMAMALGAELIDTEYIKPSYGFIRNAADANDFSMIFYSGAVILNQNGERFVDESMSYKDIGPIALVQPNGRSYIIFDENIRLMQLQNRPPEKRLFGNITQDSKHIYFAEDLSEAARRAGLNPENTVRTIQNYNQSIKTGKEVSFKRLSLSGAFGTPVPIEKAPFYIMPATCGIMGTYCGIRVNAKTQVLIQGKYPVKNLLAAGEIMGGVHGANFTPGCGFGKALAFGRAAGETAAGVLAI